MSAPFHPKEDSILTFKGFIESIRRAAKNFKDIRKGKNKTYDKIEDFVMSAFSLFYLQSPSFLSFQREMESAQGNNNARTLFGIDKIPSDNHIRDMLDSEDPKTLFPVFRDVFKGIHEAGWFKDFRGHSGDLLLSFDGTEFHSSNKIYCKHCKTKTYKDEHVNYSHAMVTAVLVKPGCSHVINLEPEFIIPQEGHTKQDSEIEASKRWLSSYGEAYQPYGLTILGDDLYAHEPFCKEVLSKKAHFIFTCLPSSHKTLYDFIEGLLRTKLADEVEEKRWTGKRHEFDRYVYINDVPLKEGKDALRVNWCELTTTDSNGKILFHNTYVTDLMIDASNVSGIVADGRARWKTENENNNTLKQRGYHLDHNFGHGTSNLCNVLATLNLLAFLSHTILAISSEAYQKVRTKIGARYKFFEHLRILTHYILFESWDGLMHFILDHQKQKLNPESFVAGFNSG